MYNLQISKDWNTYKITLKLEANWSNSIPSISPILAIRRSVTHHIKAAKERKPAKALASDQAGNVRLCSNFYTDRAISECDFGCIWSNARHLPLKHKTILILTRLFAFFK